MSAYWNFLQLVSREAEFLKHLPPAARRRVLIEKFSDGGVDGQLVRAVNVVLGVKRVSAKQRRKWKQDREAVLFRSLV